MKLTLWLKSIFFNGIKAFVPVAVTFALAVWVFDNIESFFKYFLQQVIPPQYYFDGLGIIVGILLIFFLGILMNAYIVNKLYEFGENLLKRIPIIKTFYNSMRDLVDFFDAKKKPQSQRTVVVETELGRMLGFITREQFDDTPEALAKPGDVAVYIPLSYQIGGLTLMLPRDKVIEIDMPAEKAMRFVLSAGIIGKDKI